MASLAMHGFAALQVVVGWFWFMTPRSRTPGHDRHMRCHEVCVLMPVTRVLKQAAKQEGSEADSKGFSQNHPIGKSQGDESQ